MLRPVSTIRAFLVALLVATPLPALAASYADPDLLNALFASLKVATSETEAAMLSDQIWQAWLSPNVPALADEMNKSALAQGSGDLKGSKAILDDIVKAYPDYAEGWNQRATVEFEMSDFPDSLADIAKTLALEPRHFGALSGRVLIEMQQGRRNEALKDMIAALAIHPFLSEKQLFPELQQEQVNL
jgi:tetratricopeptide (TPR) repeat protein